MNDLKAVTLRECDGGRIKRDDGDAFNAFCGGGDGESMFKHRPRKLRAFGLREQFSQALFGARQVFCVFNLQ